jgi:two-component system phosphate regulon sensor histidine kinase PhoR
MKLNRTYLFIALSSVALTIVLIIQVNWIYETAGVKEKMFNEKANMVLSKTAEALSKDTVTVKKLKVCVGINEKRKVDSLFHHYMRVYRIQVDYTFEVKPFAPVIKNDLAMQNELRMNQQGCYQACVPAGAARDTGPSHTNGIDLKLIFPEKEKYIMEEMGLPFISSVILILVVLVLTSRTMMSLAKEKEISEHTSDFLNNMTHEFKTPLTNIALAGKMIIKEANIGQEEKIRHYSGIILEENEKLRLQVEHVLSMTALERGEIPLQKTELDVHQLVRDTVKRISLQVENKQGHVTLNLNAGDFVIMGDKVHLTNALCNLIDNAVKYSAEVPELLVQTFNKDRQLVLTVSDNGIGIEEHYHKKVFDKFFRVPTGNVHDVKGFGLGLTYVRSIIELHGGSIELQSEKNKGTVFIIRLPYV